MPLLDWLLVWWYGRQLRAHHRQRAAAPAETLRFPLQMGLTMSQVRAAVEREYGEDTALDSPYPTTDDRRDRLRQYILNNPGGASVNVAYKYREPDQRVWAIRVSHAAPSFEGHLGDVSLTEDVASVIARLGPPTSDTQRAPVIRAYVWEFKGGSLRPLPPGESKHKDVRYLDVPEGELDEVKLAKWVKQAGRLPGWGGK